jgi:hypothetical protein
MLSTGTPFADRTDTKVCLISWGRPILAEACLLGDQPECTDYIVRGQQRAHPGREDEAMLLPESPGQQAVPLLLLHLLSQRFDAALRLPGEALGL